MTGALMSPLSINASARGRLRRVFVELVRRDPAFAITFLHNRYGANPRHITSARALNHRVEIDIQPDKVVPAGLELRSRTRQSSVVRRSSVDAG
jgi:hypothetical protein